MSIAIGKDLKTYGIGESCGTGQYECCQCGAEVTVTGPCDQLPPCKNCGASPGVRYRPVDQTARESHGVEQQDHEVPRPPGK